MSHLATTVFTGLLLLCLPPDRATAQCPAGFLDAGEVSASAGAGRYQEVNLTKELLLPKGIQLDSSYHQKSIQAAGDGAASEMRAVQIPAGIHLIPGGTSGGKWWSISNPKLESVAVDDHNKVTQWKFKIDLYANSGGRPAAPARGGATPPATARGGGIDVRVRVCAKVEQ